ncbi:MAG: hypothetical protein ABF868_06370, partial [Sporolactobacillus sp.]
ATLSRRHLCLNPPALAGGRLVFAFILMSVKMIAGQSWYDVYSIMFASMAARHLYKGFKLHQGHEIAFGIIFGLLAVGMPAAALFAILGTGK